MKRPIFVTAIASINGIIIGVYFKWSIPFIFMGAALIILFGSKKLMGSSKKKQCLIKGAEIKKIIILYLIILNIFSIYTCKKDYSYNNKYKDFVGSEIQIVGTIISDIEEKDYKHTYKIKVELINGDRSYKGDYLLINSKKFKANEKLEYGDKIQLKGIYKKVPGQRNYKGFDYQFYLKTQNIYGIVYESGNFTKILKKRNTNIFNIISHNLGINIKENIKKVLPERTANLEIGILLGDSEEIEEDIKKAFQNSNVTHMIAVSGQHIGYVILMIKYIFQKRIFGIRGQKIISVIIILLFIRLTGSTLSVFRAGFSIILYIIASLIHRKADVKTTISIVALISIIRNPFNIFNVGMQLSYAGTISIILFYNILIEKITNISSNIYSQELQLDSNEGVKISIQNKLEKMNKKSIRFVLESFALTLSANIFIIPIMIYHFNTISLTILFSNLIIGPLVGVSMILGFLATFLSFISIKISKIPGFILNLILNTVIKIAKFFGNLRISKIYVVTPSVLQIAFFYIVTFVVFYSIKNSQKVKKIIIINRTIVKKIILIILIISIIIKISVFIIPKNLMIYFVDVGQGDCSLIITPHNKKILIDGGGSSDQDEYNVGQQTLIPYLLDRKIKTIDYIIVSHFDSDHVGGLLTVMEELKVNNVVISKQGNDSENYRIFKRIVRKKKINVIMVENSKKSALQKLRIDNDLYFDILWPNNSKLIAENVLNNNSIVCKLHYKNFSMLFTGDIEEIAEKQIVQEYKGNLQVLNAIVLKVGHHGSKTSSIQEFIEVVEPRIALIGVGENNKFGHPNKGVLERLKAFRYKNIPHRSNGRNNANHR